LKTSDRIASTVRLATFSAVAAGPEDRDSQQVGRRLRGDVEPLGGDGEDAEGFLERDRVRQRQGGAVGVGEPGDGLLVVLGERLVHRDEAREGGEEVVPGAGPQDLEVGVLEAHAAVIAEPRGGLSRRPARERSGEARKEARLVREVPARRLPA
jgi:hypothetical protein